MHTKLAPLALALALALVIGPWSLVLAQGPLTPPGAPAPTMKTLDQVEARTIVNSTNTPGGGGSAFIISAPGSYYLGGNVTVSSGNAVTISADDVTLDLNGFTVSSAASPAAGTGVVINAVRNVAVLNGHVHGTTTFASGTFTPGGFINGVRSVSSAGFNQRVSGIGVLGVSGDGIDLQNSTDPTNLVERCVVAVCGGAGIRAAIIRDCGAKNTGANAISGEIVSHCFGQTVNSVSTAFGILATSMADNCRGIADTGTGVSAVNATNCRATSTSGVGLTAANAHNCEGISTSGAAGINIITGTASFCRGQRAGGVAIAATNAVACTSNGGTINATTKSLGTP